MGEDTGTQMNLDYDVPFNFTGKLGKLFIELKRSNELSQRNAEVDTSTVACALRCASQGVGRAAGSGPPIVVAAVHDALFLGYPHSETR